ncbi:MAG TPA: DUF86 domain-containing protein [Spirochaetota bacterium]|nr:DUF86 domain-containing protein [Spirochaetota bacterium]
MRRDDSIYVLHAIEAAEKAIQFVEEEERTSLEKDEKLSLALIRLLEVIGEAVSGISESTKNKYPEIPWKKMVAMRNRLIHGYFDVNYDIVWDTIKNDLPDVILLLKDIQ